jgi:predicted CDP-diglyceride synthetase/phosphatidate cytidylyltransferase
MDLLKKQNNRRLIDESKSFIIHSVVCLTRGPWPIPKRVLHRVRSSASSFNIQYIFFSLKSSNSCLRLLPRLSVIYILPSCFPSITCFRRQFLRKMWPIQLAFLLFIVCTIFLCSLTLCNTSSFLTRSVQLIFSILLQHHMSKLSRYFWSTSDVPF